MQIKVIIHRINLCTTSKYIHFHFQTNTFILIGNNQGTDRGVSLIYERAMVLASITNKMQWISANRSSFQITLQLVVKAIQVKCWILHLVPAPSSLKQPRTLTHMVCQRRVVSKEPLMALPRTRGIHTPRWTPSMMKREEVQHQVTLVQIKVTVIEDKKMWSYAKTLQRHSGQSRHKEGEMEVVVNL